MILQNVLANIYTGNSVGETTNSVILLRGILQPSTKCSSSSCDETFQVCCVCVVPWLSRMTMPPSIRARGVAEWFDWKENDVNQKLWPSRSLNLNPIEHNYRRIWPTSWTELSAAFIITPREETSFGQRVFIPAVQFQRISVTRTTKHLLCMNVCLSIVR